MKQIILTLLLASLFLANCGSGADKECRIHGTVNNPNLEGACIYLIAFDSNIRDSVGIDSAFIKDGRFEISTEKQMMGILRLDYHYRYGIQDLLVVEEPGDLNVVIDSVSRSYGTPSNDVLQGWKNQTEIKNELISRFMRSFYKARQEGDSVLAKHYSDKADSLSVEHRHTTWEIADNLPDGTLKEFFYKMFPKSYKQHMPDGTVKEVKVK